MILYFDSILRPLRFTAQERRFGTFGIFFAPVFIHNLNFATGSIPTIQLMLFLRFLGSNPGLVEQGGIVVALQQRGETYRYASEDLKYYGSRAHALRIFVHALINYCAACVLTLSLPIFVASSDTPIKCILYAAASTFIIHLDDVAPMDTLTYTISDVARVDVEEELPAQVTESSAPGSSAASPR